jgi:hypothetical protein
MNQLLDRPRFLGLVCAAGAVGLGLAYMTAAGAPPQYLAINLAALILGAAVWLAIGQWKSLRPPFTGHAVFALALPLMVTALLGVPVEGASRWVNVGPLSVQISLIVLPAIITLYARRPDAIGTAGIAIAALALAAQPDRAMAGVLAAGMGAVLLSNAGRLPAFALAAAVAAFGVTLIQPDALPAVPFVDHILYTAFDVHVLAGAAVVAGAFLLLAPALVGALRGRDERAVMVAFGAGWAAVVAAAAIGNYPTPVVGYGGSAVLGYLLSVALLPSSIGDDPKAESAEAKAQAGRSRDADSVELAILNQV